MSDEDETWALDSSSSDDIDDIIVMAATSMLADMEMELDFNIMDETVYRGKAANKSRSFVSAESDFNRKYFCLGSVYNDVDFERRFRMPRTVFERIQNGLMGRGIFVKRTDALNKQGISPLVRIVAALRILAYGKTYDEIDELCEMSRTSARESFHAFVREINSVFGEEYLRAPTEVDLQRILGINSERGFPGCVGSWDCQHWEWKNCPVAWAGQFKGKEKKPTIVLEAVADAELWIWACHFGMPGSLNDINILDSSPIVSAILEGRLLPEYEYILNGQKRTGLYFLVDGIYPPWSIFVSTISECSNKKERLFASVQESVRKDVERAFGVLVSRWALIAKPCSTWDRAFAGEVMKAAIILHNMVVEARRDGYKSELWSLAEDAVEKGLFLDENGEQKTFTWRTQETVSRTTTGMDNSRWASHISVTHARMKDEVLHFSLKRDLVEHIWAEDGRHGSQE